MNRKTSTNHAIVFAGGEADASPVSIDDALVIAADSGYDHARISGIVVDILVGDLDSISDGGLDHARTTGVQIDRHDVDKDATDVELAFDTAIASGCTSIDLYGGEGGKLDHLLGVASLVAADRHQDIAITWHTGSGTVNVVRHGRPLSAVTIIGGGVSLVAVTDATGVTTTGLAWKLDGEILKRGTSRGLSNRAVEMDIAVSIESGVLLAIVEKEVSS